MLILCPQIVEDHQQRALSQGSEDTASAETLQRCEELLPGQVTLPSNIFIRLTILRQVKVKSSLLTIKVKQSANVWKKV